MHILVTGGTGFLGSHLISAFLKQDYQVTLLKRSTSSVDRLGGCISAINLVDVDMEPIENAFQYGPIDVVVHAATTYGRSSDTTAHVFDSNVVFPSEVLNSAVEYGVKAFINTDTFFNSPEGIPLTISDYTLSKQKFIEFLHSQRDNIKTVTLRLQHVYGPKDNAGKFISWLHEQLATHVKRISLTDGRSLRDFVYIADVVAAYMLVIQSIDSLKSNITLDVGTGSLIQVRDFVEMYAAEYQRMDKKSKSILGFGDVPTPKTELSKSSSNISGLTSIGWKSNTTLRNGIICTLRDGC